MRLPSLPSRRLFLALVLAAGACSDPLAPDEVSGIYVTVAPGAFATLVRDNGDVRLVADSLFLLTNGTARRHVVWEGRRPWETEFARYEHQDEWTYTIAGTTVRLRPVCPDGLCIVADKLPLWEMRFMDSHLWSADRVKYIRQ